LKKLLITAYLKTNPGTLHKTPQYYAVFDALQSGIHPVNRKNLQAKLFHKQFFEVFSVVMKSVDVGDHSMALGMA
jgi:hypothetical protein